MQIKDKKCIIVGAIGRLGVPFCRELLRNGAASIVIIGNQEEHGTVFINELNLEFGQKRVTFSPCDLANSATFDATFKEAIAALGGLDILVNNADLIDESDITKAVDVNVTAVIRSTLLGVQQMGKDMGGRGGIVVNVTTIFGLEPVPQLPVYSTAKQTVISFSRSYSQPYHYNRTGVKIVSLCPGFSGQLKKNDDSVDTNLKTEESPECLEICPQKAETVAHGLVYVIRCAQNGSVWVSENGHPVYEIQLPDILTPKLTDDDDDNENFVELE